MVDLITSAQEFRATQMGEEDQKKYKALKAELDAIQKEMMAWLKTNPAQTPENLDKFTKQRMKLQELSDQLGKY